MTIQFILSESESTFGWPLVKRTEYFSECLKSGASKYSHSITFQGMTQPFPVVTIPIDLAKYRLSNGRTASLQQEYLARHPSVAKDFFKRDPESLEAQRAQHEILSQVINEQGLLKFFSNPANDQTEPIILDFNGFVVNGNRRLTAWRKLYCADRSKFGHFAHVKAVMLPYCDERDLDKLEAALQIHQNIKAEYSWDTRANMMLQKQEENGMTLQEIADMYKMKLSDVEELIDMRNYAAEYLRGRGREDIWSEVSKSEFAFKKVRESRKRMSNAPVGRKELFMQSAFVLIDSTEKEGRLYEQIPEIYQYLDKIEESLQKEFKVQPSGDDRGIDELFGKQDKADISGPLAREIQKEDNAPKARLIINEVIKAQSELKKEAKNAGFLLKKIADANADLAAAINDGLRAESTRLGVDVQLIEVEQKVARIREWLADNA